MKNTYLRILGSMIITPFIYLAFSCSKEEIIPSDISIVKSPDDPIVQTHPADSVAEEQAVDTTAVDSVVVDSAMVESAMVDSAIVDTPLPMGGKTRVSIHNNQFYINGKPTYEGRFWEGNKIEGLLMNSRMVQGIFDDLNPATAGRFAYPDTRKWDPDRNTREFVNSMDEWKQNGLLAFTLNLQGGSPTGYGNKQGWINSAFDEKGELRPAYMNRLDRILNKADELQMVVILGYFYFGQDEILEDETAVINAVDNITNWILDRGYENLLIEINNECNYLYDHDILGPNRVTELIQRVQQTQNGSRRLLVSTSFTGGVVPRSDVVQASDYVLLHGNGVGQASKMNNFIASTKNVSGYNNKPIIINEDDHYNFTQPANNLVTAVGEYVSWGFFDYRREGEGFDHGYQSVPVDWGINSSRKQEFFTKIREITGY